MPSAHLRSLKHGKTQIATFDPPEGVIQRSDLAEIARHLRRITPDEEPPEFLLGFSKVSSFDTGLLDLLAQLRSDLQGRNGHLALVGVSDSLKELFKVTGGASEFAFYENESQALAALAKVERKRQEAEGGVEWSYEKRGEIFVVIVHTRRLKELELVTALAKGIERLLEEQDARHILLDFTEVEFMPSSMLGRLLQLRQEVAAKQGTFGLVGLSSAIRQVLATTRLDRFFEIYPSVEKALKKFRPQ